MDYRRLVIGDWLLDIGYWLLAIEYGLLNMGGKAAYPCLYTLHPTLYTKSDSAHASTPYTLHPTLYTISASAPASNL